MIAKLITVHVKPGHWEAYQAYQASQAIWNRETHKAAGYLGEFCGQAESPDKRSDAISHDNIAHLMLFWRSRADLDRWMATDHDRIATMAGADRHYERIETRVLDSFDSEQSLPAGSPNEITPDAAKVQFWSEAHRATAALRTALRMNLFEILKSGPIPLANLAKRTGSDPAILKHILRALLAMELLQCDDHGWANSRLAERTLVKDAMAYQGDIVLHNSRPASIANMLTYGQQLGLPEDHAAEDEDFALFLRAMANTAAGGQARTLMDAIDLSGAETMLDIGGATGPYSIALCNAYPNLRSTILDQTDTVPVAQATTRDAGLGDRIEVVAHDYRTGPFPGPVDIALLSNVLRGETPDGVVDILQRVRDALRPCTKDSPGGRVIIHDHFPDEDNAGHSAQTTSGLRAALFGMHLVDKSNYTMKEMISVLDQTGYRVVRTERLTHSVVMNGLIEGVPD